MLPDGFQFSQGSLKDYLDCPRRFELRYIQGVRWPGVVAEPVEEQERQMRQGARLHHLIYQHHLGVPAESLSAMQLDADVRRWWETYLESPYAYGGMDGVRHVETTASAALAGYRLLAKYDLVLVTDSRVLIVDWKTSARRPRDTNLIQRMQTRVYRYIMAQAGVTFTGGQPVPPESVEMVYWFANAPESPLHLQYTTGQYEADERDLGGLIEEIANRRDFPLTDELTHCDYCTYRSLCNRGKVAGELDALEAEDEETAAFTDSDVDLDFDQIGEIAF